jgi:hypothetical protein
MRIEHVDRRALAAVNFIDAATERRILRKLAPEAAGARWIRSRGGPYVIASAPGLEDHTNAFIAPPSEPDLNSIELTIKVSDPQMEYLRRRKTIRLPRNPNPQRRDRPDSLFNPVDIPLYYSPRARTLSSWSGLRLTVKEEGTLNLLPWAALRVRERGDNKLKAIGLADHRGEAMIPIIDIPLLVPNENGNGAPAKRETEVVIEVFFDAAVNRLASLADLEAGRDPNKDYFPDPDQMLQGQPAGDVKPASGKAGFNLRAGEMLTETLLVKLA